MSEFERQHPVAAVSRAFALIRGNIVTILIFLFVGAQSENFPFLWWLGAGFSFLLIMGALNWWRFLYKLDGDTLHIKSGIFVRKNLYLTKDRIQVIDITSGIIQRMFGLVKLDIQTAGSSSRQAALDAISLEKATEINRILRQIDPHGPLSQESDADPEGVPAISSDDIRKRIVMPNKELLIAASTSGSFGIALSILATLFSQIEPLISESVIFEYIFDLLPSQTDTLMIISVILIFIIFAWLISFFSTLFKYGNFILEVKEKEIVISRGIFEKKRVTIPYNRIQAIHITEGVIRQPLGYASIHLESAGYGDEKGTGSIVLYPLIQKERILALLNDALPDYQKEIQGVSPPARSIRRYILRTSFIITILTALAFWWLQLNLLIWILPVISVYWGWLRYSDAAVARGNDILLLRSRGISKSTAYLKKNRIQDLTIVQSPFQKMRNLCSVVVYVASGDRGKSFSVQDIDLQEGERMLTEFRKERPAVDDQANPVPTGMVLLPGWN